VIIQRAYRFRVYPTVVQIARMKRWRASLRWLWNLALEQRRYGLQRQAKIGKGGHDERVFMSYFEQSKQMTSLCEVDERLADVPAACRQQVLRDLDLAYQRCFQKLTREPRFKGHRQEDKISIYVPDVNGWHVADKTLKFRKLGDMRIVVDRPINGIPTSCRLVQDVDEHYAVIVSNIEIADPAPNLLPAVGVNRGAVHGIADSTGRVELAPRPLNNELATVKRLARALSRKEPQSKNAEKARLRLAKKHQKIRRRRNWWQHQQSLHYACSYSMIGIEAFETQRMTSSKPDENVCGPKNELNRAILDVGWYDLESQIRYKAEERGARVVRVDPAFISRDDSTGGPQQDLPASGNAMFTAADGTTMLGDVNAARNVLARALATTPSSPKKRKRVQIPGRKTPETAVKPTVDACGGQPLSGPDETGISACTVRGDGWEPTKRIHGNPYARGDG
jgi:putative transposase